MSVKGLIMVDRNGAIWLRGGYREENMNYFTGMAKFNGKFVLASGNSTDEGWKNLYTADWKLFYERKDSNTTIDIPWQYVIPILDLGILDSQKQIRQLVLEYRSLKMGEDVSIPEIKIEAVYDQEDISPVVLGNIFIPVEDYPKTYTYNLNIDGIPAFTWIAFIFSGTGIARIMKLYIYYDVLSKNF